MTTMRRALVTGAASGLGRALAVALGRDGWEIALADIDQTRLEETLGLVKAAGGAGRVELLDVTSPEQWQVVCDRLRSDWPALDLLVNNAGVACEGEVGTCPLEDWRWTLETNLFGAIHGCHTCLDWLKQSSRSPHIVNVASVAAALSAPTMGAYNVSKAGVLALSETLFTELGPQGVGVTVACPGFFDTDLLSHARFQTEQNRTVARGYMLTARFTADDVARAILKAVARRQLYVVLPRRARLIWRFKRLAPRTWLRLLASGYRRQRQRQRALNDAAH
jgi:NAD(P)-dependent dehydrogenase (short-subunit alcohol dehydrogenase family)